MSVYGNTSWEIFVYGTYAIVALFLFVYIFFAIYVRKSALNNLEKEGFLGDKNET